MFDVELRIDEARALMREYVYLRAELDELEALANDALGKAILAYECLDEIPEVQRPDRYRATRIGSHLFGEDLVGELAMANRTSEGAARMLVSDVADLMHQLPDCWNKVTDLGVKAPLWQARRIVASCAGLDGEQHRQVDAGVSPSLGTVAPGRLFPLITAQVKKADPTGTRNGARDGRQRYVRTGGDDFDPLTGWMFAKTERADAIFFDATIQLIADALAGQGDARSQDERRAAAIGVIANPAAAVQLIGVHTTRSMISPPTTDAEAAAVVEQAKQLPPLVPHTQLYVHVYADNLDDPDEVARIESVGPVLVDQVKQLTGGSVVKVTKTVHVGAGSVGVDAYEIPDRIREQVIARDRHVLAPWSSIQVRRQDLDHIVPYQPNMPNQTRADNLAAQSRGFHRWKTHAGWHIVPDGPGSITWTSGAGQVAHVDNTGTHPLRI